MADATITIEANLIDKISGTLSRTKLAFTEFNSAMMVAASVGRTLKGVFEATVGTFAEYAGNVALVARTAGTSAEEASRMIQVFGHGGYGRRTECHDAEDGQGRGGSKCRGGRSAFRTIQGH